MDGILGAMTVGPPFADEWLTQERRRLFCHAPLPCWEADPDPSDAWTYPGRALTLVRPGRDAVLLPAGNPALREFARFCVKQLGLDAGQIWWVESEAYELHEDASAILEAVSVAMRRPQDWDLVPFAPTPAFSVWASELPGARWARSPAELPNSEKRLLHDSDGGSLLLADIPRPEGRYARDLSELRVVWGQVDSQLRWLIKPVEMAGGHGIEEASDQRVQSYDFPFGPVFIERRLPVDGSPLGEPQAPSLQFLDGHRVGPPTGQLQRGFGHTGNHCPGGLLLDLEAELCALGACVSQRLQAAGDRRPFGLDFVVSEGQPYLVDLSLGRFTAGHFPQLFCARHAPGSAWISERASSSRTIESYWSDLEEQGLALHPGRSRTGVFPLCFLRDMSVTLLSLAPDLQQARRGLDQALALL